MLEMIKGFFIQYHNKKAFFTLIGLFFSQFSPEYALILRAYRTAKVEFRNKVREEGVRYFEHLRCVTLILILYLRVRDAEVIAAALLHDIIEDIKGWDEQRVAHEFTPRVARLVFSVTKPDEALFGGSKEARNHEYHEMLMRVEREAAMIKLCDRLHNLLTLLSTSPEKQMRKVLETENFYLRIAEKHTILIHELEAALLRIKQSWEPVDIE